MEIKKQQSPPKSVQPQKEFGSNQQNKQHEKTFTNPICKQTFTALPHIYGRKQSRARAQTEPSPQPRQSQKKMDIQQQRRFSLSMLETHNKQKRQLSERAVKLSIPKHRGGCTKKNCTCNQQLQKSRNKKKRATFVSTLVGHIKLPDIQNYDTDDLQSNHKVLLKTSTAGISFKKCGQQSIINEKQKLRIKSNTTPSPTKTKNKQKLQKIFKNNIDNQRQVYMLTKVNLNVLKTKHKVKAKFNHQRFDIQQQSQQQNQVQQQNLPEKLQKKFSFSYRGNKTQQSSSVVLNQSRFQSSKLQNSHTQALNNLKKAQKIQYLDKKNVKNQIENGLFIVPTQQQYLQYLKNYEKINMNFNLKQLVKKPSFRIQKGYDQVYFGEIDDQGRKNGQGITVTTKGIYEGRYKNNQKSQGCQRNADGVYIGTYVNDLRSGYGAFRWFNGQYFEGNWENGLKNGFGVWRSLKGDRYQGEWVQNKQQGKGLFRHKTSTYRGQFKNFLKHGFGQEIFANGDRYKGNYMQGRPNGKGRYQWQNGGYYQGSFLKGMRQGKGKWVVPKSFSYEVQAPLNKTLNMDLVNRLTPQDKFIKANLCKVRGLMEDLSVKIKVIRKQKQIRVLNKTSIEINKVVEVYQQFLFIFQIMLFMNRLNGISLINLQSIEELMKNLTQNYIYNAPSIGKYEIIRKIGRGLTAEVYEANSINHGKVSVKIIQPSFRKTQIGSSLINNQIFILQTLNHKNVLKMIQKIEKNNKMHIITQYCQGGNLQNFLQKYKKLSQSTAISLMKKIVQGCIYLKRKNIIHRDLKPSNIFLKDSQPIIADFGFAVYSHNKKLLDLNAGSPLYMPIQSLKNKIFSQKSDVFAVGVIFYQMLTGRLPWIASSQDQLIQKLKYPPQLPKQLKNRVGNLILKCLSRQSRDRPTFQEILSSLNEKKEQIEINTQLKDNKQRRQLKSLSFALNVPDISSQSKVYKKNETNLTKRNKQNKQNNTIKSKRKITNQKARSITLNLCQIKNKNNLLKEERAIIQQDELNFVSLNADEFKFLPSSLIQKFKYILYHYKRVLGASANNQEEIKYDSKDQLIQQVKKCNTELQICKVIQKFVRRLYRLTKSYKQYKGCLIGIERLHKRINQMII